jgi:CbbQ/NirQ/NorQ C-terminal
MAATHYIETLARRIVAEVDHVTAERRTRWVTLQQVARRLKVHHSSAAAAVRVAVDGGWLVAEGSPPHSICRAEIGRTLPQPESPYAKEHSIEAPKKGAKI